MISQLGSRHLLPLLALVAGCASAPKSSEDNARVATAMAIEQRSTLRRPEAVGRDPSSELVLAAMNYLDLPYQHGGSSTQTGFDCSGFTRHIFAQSLGLALPRRAEEQVRSPDLQPVPRDALRAGDLVFFNTLRRAHSHVGIYVGEDKFIHAPKTGAQIRIENMSNGYWGPRYTAGRRAVAVATLANP